MKVSHTPFPREILFSNETINVKFQFTCSIAASSDIEGLQAWKSLENCKKGFNLIWTPDRSVIRQITAFPFRSFKILYHRKHLEILHNWLYLLAGEVTFYKGEKHSKTWQGQKYSLTMSFMSYIKPLLSRRSINCTGSNITLDGDSGYLNSLSETIRSRKAPSERPVASQWLHANTNKT